MAGFYGKFLRVKLERVFGGFAIVLLFCQCQTGKRGYQTVAREHGSKTVALESLVRSSRVANFQKKKLKSK